MTAYEAAHFGYDLGGRAVADAALDLFVSSRTNGRVSRRVAERFALGLAGSSFVAALGYPRISNPESALYAGIVKLRGRIVRLLRPRAEQIRASELADGRAHRGADEL